MCVWYNVMIGVHQCHVTIDVKCLNHKYMLVFIVFEKNLNNTMTLPEGGMVKKCVNTIGD